MASVKIYLDNRRQRQDGTSPLKLSISHRSKTALVSLNLYVKDKQWNGREVVDHPRRKLLNNNLEVIKLDVDTELLNLQRAKRLGAMSIVELREHIENFLRPQAESKPITFTEKFIEYRNSRRTERTREIYTATLNWIYKFEPNADSLLFSDITRRWLERFMAYMAESSPSVNARNIHLRNIRAVFNSAIDDGQTTAYPFRKFRIKNQQTPKRSITRDMVHQLFSYTPKGYQQKYLDIFKLLFYLIGINIKDLCYLKPDDYYNGFISYNRFKGGKFYQIQVEPEAQEIIERYRGKEWLLNILDRNKNYKNYCKNLNMAMKVISEELGMPKLTTYWMRHTWATLAAELDIPKETIAASLGHGSEKVTDVYIRFDLKKVWEANRRVIDYISKEITEE